jgi:hypothetical protein
MSAASQLQLPHIEVCLSAIDAAWQNGSVREPKFAAAVIETQAILNSMKNGASGIPPGYPAPGEPGSPFAVHGKDGHGHEALAENGGGES